MVGRAGGGAARTGRCGGVRRHGRLRRRGRGHRGVRVRAGARRGRERVNRATLTAKIRRVPSTGVCVAKKERPSVRQLAAPGMERICAEKIYVSRHWSVVALTVRSWSHTTHVRRRRSLSRAVGTSFSTVQYSEREIREKERGHLTCTCTCALCAWVRVCDLTPTRARPGSPR